jgi:hypothetical protein
MHRTRLIVSTIALLSLASFAVADAPSRGAADASKGVCSLTGGACPRPCPDPCPSSCGTAQACGMDGDIAVR